MIRISYSHHLRLIARRAVESSMDESRGHNRKLEHPIVRQQNSPLEEDLGGSMLYLRIGYIIFTMHLDTHQYLDA
jgi:hypothetical protein